MKIERTDEIPSYVLVFEISLAAVFWTPCNLQNLISGQPTK